MNLRDRCFDELIGSFLSLKITLACFFPVYNCMNEPRSGFFLLLKLIFYKLMHSYTAYHVILFFSVFSAMQIPYPKRKFIFDGEPSKEEKPDPHKVMIQ